MEEERKTHLYFPASRGDHYKHFVINSQIPLKMYDNVKVKPQIL